MPEHTNKGLRKYFRLEVLIPLLVLLIVSVHDWKSKTAFKVVVDGESMAPTYQSNEFVYATSVYSRLMKDDVVIISFNNESNLIKRIRFLPGETFWVIKEDATHWEPVPDNAGAELKRLGIWPMQKITLQKDQIWLEGDNKDASYDSRMYGPFELKYIRGVVVPWRKDTNTKDDTPTAVKRLYNLRKEGKAITKDKFIM